MDEADDLFALMLDLREEEVCRCVETRLQSGGSAESMLNEVQAALVEIGRRFEAGQWFISELVYAGEIMKKVTRLIEPHVEKKQLGQKGKVVVGTVAGDIHDIGKDLVILLLRGAGFEVVDLGVDVSAESFVAALEESQAKLVGMSALLTMSFGSITRTVEAIRRADLREKVLIIAGGAPVSERVCRMTGCDLYGKDAFAGVKAAAEAYNPER